MRVERFKTATLSPQWHIGEQRYKSEQYLLTLSEAVILLENNIYIKPEAFIHFVLLLTGDTCYCVLSSLSCAA